jgi:hypothetical protein
MNISLFQIKRKIFDDILLPEPICPKTRKSTHGDYGKNTYKTLTDTNEIKLRRLPKFGINPSSRNKEDSK